jgi:hypothetical protein
MKTFDDDIWQCSQRRQIIERPEAGGNDMAVLGSCVSARALRPDSPTRCMKLATSAAALTKIIAKMSHTIFDIAAWQHCG